MQIIGKLREADARLKGVGKGNMTDEDVMHELLYFILHWPSFALRLDLGARHRPRAFIHLCGWAPCFFCSEKSAKELWRLDFPAWFCNERGEKTVLQKMGNMKNRGQNSWFWMVQNLFRSKIRTRILGLSHRKINGLEPKMMVGEWAILRLKSEVCSSVSLS